MEKYASNSHKFKQTQKEAQNATPAEDRPKAEKVINGTAKTKKKNEIRKFADVFMAEDVTSIKTFIIEDVVVPAIKNTVSDTVRGIFDIIRNSIDVALFGQSGAPKKSGGSKVSYTSYYERERDRKPVGTANSRNQFDFDDIIYLTRGDAQLVLDQMDDMADRYDGVVRVSDMYEFAGLVAPYTANRYGWTRNVVRNAAVVHGREGYVIKLPPPFPID